MRVPDDPARWLEGTARDLGARASVVRRDLAVRLPVAARNLGARVAVASRALRDRLAVAVGEARPRLDAFLDEHRRNVVIDRHAMLPPAAVTGIAVIVMGAAVGILVALGAVALTGRAGEPDGAGAGVVATGQALFPSFSPLVGFPESTNASVPTGSLAPRASGSAANPVSPVASASGAGPGGGAAGATPAPRPSRAPSTPRPTQAPGPTPAPTPVVTPAPPPPPTPVPTPDVTPAPS